MTLSKHKNTKHVVQSCAHCDLKCLTLINLLKHISIEYVEEELELDQTVKVVQQSQKTEVINKNKVGRSNCEACEIVLTEEYEVKNHEDNNMCRLCTYKSILNMWVAQPRQWAALHWLLLGEDLVVETPVPGGSIFLYCG